MTVYVDDSRIEATVGRYRSRWSHLFSDSATYDELHAFAARLGLRRSWFQHKPPRGPRSFDYSHYDLTEGKRERAIQLGATPVSWWDTPGILRSAQVGR